MTYIQKCEWLKLYQVSLRRQKILVRRIREAKDQAESVTQALSPIVSSGCSGDKTGRAIEMMDAYQHQLCHEIQRSQELCYTIRKVIAELEDPLLVDLLELCYIDGLHRGQAADKLRVSDRHFRRLHRQAVEALNIPMNASVGVEGSIPRAVPIRRRPRRRYSLTHGATYSPPEAHVVGGGISLPAL